MAWYFNFCAPTLPNDPTIAFHRGFQTAQVIVLLVFFTLYHTYYKVCKSTVVKQEEEKQQQVLSEISQVKSQKQDKKQEVQSQSKSDSDESKSVSIAEKLEEFSSIDGNQSTVPFKDTGDKFLQKKSKKNSQDEQTDLYAKKQVTAEQIQSYFPIVFGHHAIAMGISIMYSPYAEQSIAAILYVLFCFILIIVNSKRFSKLTIIVWILMAFLNVFIMMSALLEVGQSNWDFVNNLCFAEQYIPLY